MKENERNSYKVVSRMQEITTYRKVVTKAGGKVLLNDGENAESVKNASKAMPPSTVEAETQKALREGKERKEGGHVAFWKDIERGQGSTCLDAINR